MATPDFIDPQPPLSKKGQELAELLNQRIVYLDGAMGTMIQRHKDLEEKDFRGERFKDHPAENELKGNNDLLSITRPDIIGDIHRKFLEAGSDIIETNTFSGTRTAQADYALEDAVGDINRASAELARKVADEYTAETGRPVWVAGAIGPTNRSPRTSTAPATARPVSTTSSKPTASRSSNSSKRGWTCFCPRPPSIRSTSKPASSP